MLRRLIGVILLVIGLVGIAFSILAANALHDGIDTAVVTLDESLQLASEGLENVIDTLEFTQTAVTDINDLIATIETTANDLSAAIDNTQPMLSSTSAVVTQDVPESLEAFQEALPALEQAASTIDSTLRTLSRFEIDQTILGFRLQYDLGIDYNPEIPFDVAITEVGESLDGLPERLREMEPQLEATSEDLTTISADITEAATEIQSINETLTELDPLLVEHIRIATEANDSLRRVRGDLDDQAAAAKEIASILFALLAVMQVPALYLGFELVTGQRDPNQFVTKSELDSLLARRAVQAESDQLKLNETLAAADDQPEPDRVDTENRGESAADQ